MFMSKPLRLLWAAVSILVVTSGYAALPQAVDGEPLPSLAPIVQRVSPAVVNIRVSMTVEAPSIYGDEMFRRFFGIPDDPRGRSREVASAGSGVIVDSENGYILTNHHVVENADQIQISLFNEETLDAEIIGSDALTDIAVLKVEPESLTEIPIGNSNDVQVGDFALDCRSQGGLSGEICAGRNHAGQDAYDHRHDQQFHHGETAASLSRSFVLNDHGILSSSGPSLKFVISSKSFSP